MKHLNELISSRSLCLSPSIFLRYFSLPLSLSLCLSLYLNICLCLSLPHYLFLSLCCFLYLSIFLFKPDATLFSPYITDLPPLSLSFCLSLTTYPFFQPVCNLYTSLLSSIIHPSINLCIGLPINIPLIIT